MNLSYTYLDLTPVNNSKMSQVETKSNTSTISYEEKSGTTSPSPGRDQPNLYPKIIIKISNNIVLGVDLSLNGFQSLATGILSYSNGIPIKTKGLYVGVMRKMLEQKNSSLVYFEEKQLLEYRVNFQLEQAYFITDQEITQITQMFAPYVEKLRKVDSQLGLFNSPRVKDIGFYHARLNLIQKTVVALQRQKNYKKNNDSSVSEFTNRKPKKLANNASIPQQRDKKPQMMHQFGTITEKDLKNQDCAQHVRTRLTNYFKIYKNQCLIKAKQGEEYHQVKLAIKRINSSVKFKENAFEKIKREKQIIRKLKSSRHFLRYYEPIEDKKKDRIYMEHVNHNLKQEIYGQHLKIEDILEYSKQTIQALQVLHASGIVHRDLKPENLMLKKVEKSGTLQKTIKIIDFGDSSLMGKSHSIQDNLKLGHTFPYSPLQCFQNGKEEYNCEKVDLWSIGLVLHELAFRSLPITTSKSMISDIYKGWKSEFFPSLNHRKHSNTRIIETILNLVSQEALKINPKHRMSLRLLRELYGYIEQFMISLNQ